MIVSLVSTSLKWPIGCFLPVARLALFFIWTVIPIHGLYLTSRRPLWCTQQCGKMSSTNFTLLLAVISDYWNAFDSRLACVSVGFQARKLSIWQKKTDQYACENPREDAPANNKRIFGAAILVSLTEKKSRFLLARPQIHPIWTKLGRVLLRSNAIMQNLWGYFLLFVHQHGRQT